MDYKILFAIFSVILLTPILLHENAFGNEANTILWADRKLTWDDLQGKITSFAPNKGAKISSDISLTYSMKYTDKYSEINECHWMFNEIFVTAFFDKEGSIVSPWELDHHVQIKNFNNWYPQSAWILNHEQRHFDIAEIHAKKFNEYAKKELLSKKFPCPTHTDLKSLESKIIPLGTEQMQEIFDDLIKDLRKMQKEYHNDVENSKDLKAQNEWDRKIDSELKRLEENSQKHKVMKQLPDSSKDILSQATPKKESSEYSSKFQEKMKTKLKEKDESLNTPKVLLLIFMDNYFASSEYGNFDLPEDYELPNWIENLVTSWQAGNTPDSEFMGEIGDMINQGKFPILFNEKSGIT